MRVNSVASVASAAGAAMLLGAVAGPATAAAEPIAIAPMINSNASGAQPLKGLPGSKLGNTDRSQTSGRVRALVAVGDIRPAAAGLGPNIGAGPSQYVLEDPGGQPPAAATAPEPAAPVVDPNVPVVQPEDHLG